MAINQEDIFNKLEDILSSMDGKTGPYDVKEFAECSLLLLDDIIDPEDMIEMHTRYDILPGTLESIHLMNHIITHMISPDEFIAEHMSKKQFNIPYYEMMCKKWFKLPKGKELSYIPLESYTINQKQTIRTRCVYHMRGIIMLHLILGRKIKNLSQDL